MKLTMIDMNMGNLQSVIEAFKRVGAELVVTSQPDDVKRAEVVILPGVGAFGEGMTNLTRKGLVDPIKEHVSQKKILFGICIGMQLLAQESEEHGLHKGLDIIPGRVTRIIPTNALYRVPNMGWCDVTVAQKGACLFNHLSGVDSFYFAHSYHFQCTHDSHIAASFDYGSNLVAAIEHENIFGVQFHPEKSQEAGLNVLESFVKICQ